MENERLVVKSAEGQRFVNMEEKNIVVRIVALGYVFIRNEKTSIRNVRLQHFVNMVDKNILVQNAAEPRYVNTGFELSYANHVDEHHFVFIRNKNSFVSNVMG